MKTDLNEMQELTNEELMQIGGGEGFWGDVGYAIGYAAGWLWDQTSGMRAGGGSAAFW
jgi:hypothetical protein